MQPMGDPRVEQERESDLEPGRPRAEHSLFVLLGALATLLALSQMFAFL